MWRCAILVFGEYVQNGESALHKTAANGHTSVLEALVAAGANVDASDGVSRHSVAVLKVKTYSVVVRIT